MRKVRITVRKVVVHEDLVRQYENPLDHACTMEEGMVFVANGWNMPDGFCPSAWESLSPFVFALCHGATDLFEGWMKDKHSAMVSCNDGFRPVSFLLEAEADDA